MCISVELFSLFFFILLTSAYFTVSVYGLSMIIHMFENCRLFKPISKPEKNDNKSDIFKKVGISKFVEDHPLKLEGCLYLTSKIVQTLTFRMETTFLAVFNHFFI